MIADGRDALASLLGAIARDIYKRMTTMDPAQPPLFVPMGRAMLCLDCEVVFDLQRQCPACQSFHITSVAKWLERGAA